MADKVTQVSELKLVAKFNDNDTRTIAVDNPKANLTAAQINAVSAIGKTTQAGGSNRRNHAGNFGR